MKNKGLIAEAVAAMLGFSGQAHAGDCWSMLQKHFTWAQSDGTKNNQLTFKLVTHRRDSRDSGYTTGVMVESGSLRR